jgi:hypothetical protein
MSVPDKIMHFREERATELERMAKLLEESIGGNISVSTSKVYTAARNLRNKTHIHPYKNGKTENYCWGYSIEDFVMDVPIPKHLNPPGIENLSVNLGINILANCNEWDNLTDPFHELSFRVTLKGIGKQMVCYSGFHIDRHDMSMESEEFHPIYHIQYLTNPNNSSGFNYGDSLSLDTPRIIHYPMDFILGIGFITSNFFPTAYDLLLDNGLFVNLTRKYQERIWKPYMHTIAHHWKPFEQTNIVWNPISDLFPTIL